ncbi:hypothetical protein L3Y34_001130 [Caenorhabditis briggsae]|uniref:Amidase domain-containing protein n=1 Tax=Caenorhabditis briggsae TaxID=6238 RepID=A0AAE9DB66_CAEBR|nr:hypothetical protein L3Y34_001130 [Caenorhabditis briggsae]
MAVGPDRVPVIPDGIENYSDFWRWPFWTTRRQPFVRDYRNAVERRKADLVAATQNINDDAVSIIVNRDMLGLRGALQNGQLTARDVVSAYVKRAIQVDEKLNCITEFIRNPIERAAALDEEVQAGRMRRGPLFGIPFSIKSNFHVEGYYTTNGLASTLREAPQPETCALVQFLINQGAIPICLTNVPQGLLAYVTSNPLHGTTKNPWKLTHTPGGSSGGEAALIAAGGAVFGVGNDLVGSLRIPAAFCGLTTLKPSQNRLPERGMNAGPPEVGQLGLSSFFTRTVEEQNFLLRLVFGNVYGPLDEHRLRNVPGLQQYDVQPIGIQPNVIQQNDIQQNDIQREEDHRRNGQLPVILYMYNDEFSPVVPSNESAVRTVIEELTIRHEAEFEFRKFCLSDLAPGEENNGEDYSFKIAETLFKNVMPDNGNGMSALYCNEPWDKFMWLFIFLLKMKSLGWWVNYITSSTLGQRFLKWISPRFACLARSTIRPNDDVASEAHELETEDIRNRWTRHWHDNNVFALVCPSFITPAQPPNYPAKLATGTFMTGLFNLFDVPAGIVPVGRVSQQDEVALNERFETRSDKLLKWQKEAAQNTRGLPNAVQVVAGMGREEDCLRVMRMIEDVSEGVPRLTWDPATRTFLNAQ